MSKYENSYELAAAVECDGLSYFILEYGLSVDDFPDDLPDEVRYALIRCLKVKEDFHLVERYLSDALDAGEPED